MSTERIHGGAVGRPHSFRRTCRLEQRRLERAQLEIDEPNGRGAHARQRLADAGCPLAAELVTLRAPRGPGRWRIYTVARG